MQFLCFWLIGVFSYLFFYEELRSKKWAFFSSITFLFCGYVLDVATRYSPISMQLFVSLSLYLIWTMYKRKEYLNYIYLTIAIVLTMGGHQVAHASFSLIMITVFFFYRYFSKIDIANRSRQLFIFFCVLITSGLIVTIRVIPVLIEMQNTARSVASSSVAFIVNGPLFAFIRLFDSEFFGITMQDHMMVFPRLNTTYTGYHLQTLFAQFFGILPALLVLWAIVAPQKGQRSFLKYYVIIVTLGLLQIEPFISFFKIILPTWHDMSVQVFLPVAFCMLAGYAAKDIEENADDFLWINKLMKHFIFWIILIISFILLLWLVLGLYKKTSLNSIRLYLSVLFFLGTAIFFAYGKWPDAIKKGFFLIFRILPILGLVAVSVLLFFVDSKNCIFLYHFRILSFSLFMLILTYLMLQTITSGKTTIRDVFFKLSILVVIIFLGVMFYPGNRDLVKDSPLQLSEILRLSMLGFARFVIVAIIFISILALLMKKRFKPAWLFPLFLAILLFDLIPTNKVHKYVYYANPFHRAKTPYPQLTDFKKEYGEYKEVLDFDRLDLKNYRVGYSNILLEKEIGQKINLALLNAYTNANATYDIRTYGGQVDGVYKRTVQFIRELAPSVNINPVEIQQTPTAEERFSDLSGIGYVYDDEQRAIKTRSTALSRFMLFKSYKVIEDGQRVLEHLKDPVFDYHNTVVLEKKPGIPAVGTDNKAEKLEYCEHSTDVIELNVSSNSSGILLFNDNYHRGWIAYVNEKEQPVFHANYNFMATTLPAGKSKIVFRFKPKEFYYSLYIMALGFLVFFLTALILYVIKNQAEDYTERTGAINHIKNYKITYLSLLFLIAVAIINMLFR